MMLKPLVAGLVYFFLPFTGVFGFLSGPGRDAPRGDTGTLEKMIVSEGTVLMEIDPGRFGGRRSSKAPRRVQLRFDAERNSFFTMVAFENRFRDVLPSALPIIAQDAAAIPAGLSAFLKQPVIERSFPGEPYELVVRENENGFPYFNIEGHQVNYDPADRLLTIEGGRLLISKEFASEIGRPGDAGVIVGEISIAVKMRAIEITKLVDGEIISDVLPALNSPEDGTTPGPDVVVGDVYGLAQFGSSGSQVGLAVGTNSCNYGTENLNWFALPNNDHPVIPQNLYRMSGGPSNTERFEQIGQSSVKHAFTALTQNLCSLGCNGVGGSRLGSGCSDPYSASLNAGPFLGSRAWINPFNGSYPRGDSATPPNDHAQHSHTGTSHRILTEVSDLNTSMNPGATYFAEGQYITPHEYAWCQMHPGECNMYNNVSYRQYAVSGTTGPFSFNPVAATVRQKAAINAWTGATIVPIEPDPGNDGIGAVVYKVTNTAPGVWHYEYAVYNQNLDRAIQSFSVPIAAGVTVSNIGFHAPPQHPGWLWDGTQGDAGFSSTPWTQTLTANEMRWNSETFAQNQNANAIRWGTMYNFRFDSNSPPEMMNATIGFFKTGNPITAAVMAPAGAVVASVSVSGRVTTASGTGIPRVWVGVMETGGEIRGAFTNNFGYYVVTGITPGPNYMVGAFSKSYTFTPQTIDVNGNVTGVNFVPDP